MKRFGTKTTRRRLSAYRLSGRIPRIVIGLGLSAIGTGVGAASAFGAFAPDQPDIPERDDPEVEASRKRALRARAAQRGRQSTILTGVTDEAPVSSRPTLLGGVPGETPTV